MKNILISFLALFLCSCSSFEVQTAEDAPLPNEMTEQKATKTPDTPLLSGLEWKTRDLSGRRNDTFNGILRKKIMVLPFLMQADFKTPGLPEHAKTMIRGAIESDLSLIYYEEPEMDSIVSGLVQNQSQPLTKIYERMSSRGISAVISGSIQDVIIKSDGDEAGLFRDRSYTVKVRLLLQVHDVVSQKVVFQRVLEGSTVEHRTEFLNPKNEEMLEYERAKTSLEKALTPVLAHMGDTLRKVAWIGRIARIEFNKIYVNGGDLTGIRKGQFLKVFEPSAEMADPQTGLSIGVKNGKFKGLLRVIENFGEDASVALVQSGTGFRENDHVMLELTVP